MGFLSELREKAKKKRKRIVLPEGDDERVLEAADYLAKEGIADIITIKRDDTEKRLNEMVAEYIEIRREHGKDASKEKALNLFLEKTVYRAAMMVRFGMADGFVAGAAHETAEVARAALYCLKIDKDIGVMSGGFLIEVQDSQYGQNGTFVFADCGIVPHPTMKQLAGIAISAARFADKILHVTPKVAMLSYSTKGSAATPDLDNIRQATDLVRKSHPDIKIDGEIQVDAAIDPMAAKIKNSVAGSSVAGEANVLIFPNLDSGNICYKLIQRLAKARAVGPVLLGLEKPCSDLSRACSVEDIIDAVAITNVMAQ